MNRGTHLRSFKEFQRFNFVYGDLKQLNFTKTRHIEHTCNCTIEKHMNIYVKRKVLHTNEDQRSMDHNATLDYEESVLQSTIRSKQQLSLRIFISIIILQTIHLDSKNEIPSSKMIRFQIFFDMHVYEVKLYKSTLFSFSPTSIFNG